MENVSEADYRFLTCNDPEGRYQLAKLCIRNDIDLTELDCVPGAKANGSNDEHRNVVHALRVAVGIWCLFVAIVGILGNLLTLFALPYAKKKNQRFFRENWNSSTMFILNLAMVDLVFCIICIPTFSIPFLTQGWEYGNMPCNGNYADD